MHDTTKIIAAARAITTALTAIEGPGAEALPTYAQGREPAGYVYSCCIVRGPHTIWEIWVERLHEGDTIRSFRFHSGRDL